MPTLRQFEAYLTVVDEGSFTRAAQQLGVSQPGLSQQVAALERELGASLFARLPRSVSLTPTGRALLPHARACVDAAARATTAARSVAGTAAGELRIAAVYSVGLGLLPGVLTRWRADHPDVGVRLLEHRTAETLTAAMQAGQADVGIGPTPAGWRGRVRVLGTEELVVLLPAEGPPDVRGGEIALSRLADVAWVQYAASHELSAELDAAAQAAGLPAAGGGAHRADRGGPAAGRRRDRAGARARRDRPLVVHRADRPPGAARGAGARGDDGRRARRPHLTLRRAPGPRRGPHAPARRRAPVLSSVSDRRVPWSRSAVVAGMPSGTSRGGSSPTARVSSRSASAGFRARTGPCR